MKVKADLHNHLSTLKEDLSDLAVKSIERASKNLGSDGILGIINAQDKRVGRYETFVSGLRGQEVFTKDQKGHILV